LSPKWPKIEIFPVIFPVSREFDLWRPVRWDCVRHQEVRASDGSFPEWEKLIAINLTGALNMHHAVLPGMAVRKAGRIVNIGVDNVDVNFVVTELSPRRTRRGTKPEHAERRKDHPSGKSSIRNSRAARSPPSASALSRPRNSTRRILPDVVLGSSANSMRRTRL
jgi:short chain dehydrogenase